MEIYTIDSSKSPVLLLQILALSSLKNLVSQFPIINQPLFFSFSIAVSFFLSASLYRNQMEA